MSDRRVRLKRPRSAILYQLGRYIRTDKFRPISSTLQMRRNLFQVSFPSSSPIPTQPTPSIFFANFINRSIIRSLIYSICFNSICLSAVNGLSSTQFHSIRSVNVSFVTNVFIQISVFLSQISHVIKNFDITIGYFVSANYHHCCSCSYPIQFFRCFHQPAYRHPYMTPSRSALVPYVIEQTSRGGERAMDMFECMKF